MSLLSRILRQFRGQFFTSLTRLPRPTITVTEPKACCLNFPLAKRGEGTENQNKWLYDVVSFHRPLGNRSNGIGRKRTIPNWLRSNCCSHARAQATNTSVAAQCGRCGVSRKSAFNRKARLGADLAPETNEPLDLLFFEERPRFWAYTWSGRAPITE